ncbi:molybdate ABC transporter permease subunit [Tatumella citrea]|uniref:Sulfate ABC transporter permease n=1 Tax=Tatumella citrea TaxID=53336 RepID=A0A1Y0LNB1_TATCI|nr:ABC transporter permease subunit [Tatumella citrea]ARU94990.1 sulfate ABC transporter permease [Tatumella citrea]ARU99028.1 sulfate ABC transporter permease [Tatumella citrea]
MPPRLPLLALLAMPALLLLALPFATLLGITPWDNFSLSYGDGGSVLVSVGYGLVSLLLIVLTGLPVAWWLASSAREGSLRRLVELLVLLPLMTPPLAMGILLISALGPYSLPGQWLSSVGLTLVNNPGAFILAQIYGGLPYFIVTARSAFAAVPRSLLEAGQTLGARPLQRFRYLVLPLSASGLASAVALAWVRAVGEFGIVMIFAYFPQGMPVKLYTNLQNDGVDAVYTLVWILLLVTLPVPLFCFMHARKRERAALLK